MLKRNKFNCIYIKFAVWKELEKYANPYQRAYKPKDKNGLRQFYKRLLYSVVLELEAA